MNTTELIELLQKVEKGVSGRSREISISICREGKDPDFISDPEIKIISTGDGVAGAELNLGFFKVKSFEDGIPCSNPGCLSHVKHPCEECGRIWESLF